MPPIHPVLSLTHPNEDSSPNSGSSVAFPNGVLVEILNSEGEVSEKPGTEK